MKARLDTDQIMTLFSPSDFDARINEELYNQESISSDESDGEQNKSPCANDDHISPHTSEIDNFKEKVRNLEENIKTLNEKNYQLEEENKYTKNKIIKFILENNY